MKTLVAVVLTATLVVAQDAPDVLPGHEALAVDQTLPGADPAPQVVEIPAPPLADEPIPPGEQSAPPHQAMAEAAPVATSQAAPVASDTAPEVPATDTPVYTVQLGAFKSRERAFALYWEMSKQLSHVQVAAPAAADGMYRVRCGTYPNYEEAKAACTRLKERGIDCFVARMRTPE